MAQWLLPTREWGSTFNASCWRFGFGTHQVKWMKGKRSMRKKKKQSHGEKVSWPKQNQAQPTNLCKLDINYSHAPERVYPLTYGICLPRYLETPSGRTLVAASWVYSLASLFFFFTHFSFWSILALCCLAPLRHGTGGPLISPHSQSVRDIPLPNNPLSSKSLYWFPLPPFRNLRSLSTFWAPWFFPLSVDFIQFVFFFGFHLVPKDKPWSCPITENPLFIWSLF